MKFLAAVFLFVFCHVAGTAQVIVTIAGTGINGYSGDGGLATNAKVTFPHAIAFDHSGDLYFTDDAVPSIRKVTHDGIISHFAGNGISGYGGDGGLAKDAYITGGGGVATDHFNNVYVADGGNHRIRKITPDGIIRTIAGTGVAGYNGDGLPATAAQLNSPQTIAIDDTGNVYICDRNNYRIRKVDTAGYIHTIAGIGVIGSVADGAKADTSAIDESWCIRLDRANNLLFNEKDRIRKISSQDGTIETLAGNGLHGYTGDGGPATTAAIFVESFTVDSFGNVFVTGANRIRKVDTGGVINTLAGTGAGGFDGDGVAVGSARIPLPSGVAFSKMGELFYAEKGSARIRKISLAWDGVNEVNAKSIGLEVFPNPTHGRVSVRINAIEREANLTIIDARGVVVRTVNVPCNVTKEIDVSGLQPGVYTVNAKVGTDDASKQLIIK